MPLSDTETGVTARAATPNGTAGPGCRPRGSIPGARRRRERPRSGWWPGYSACCSVAAGAPTPLYGIYRAQLRFSATTLTAVFAVYALVLLLTLLVFGSVSDYLGRRRVILAALTVTAGACAVFLARTASGCCSPRGRCRAWPSAPPPARSARR